tara:strand:+ start:303 stop:662 length:360 start_codon:yes stop_codon:yes gene_type:complete
MEPVNNFLETAFSQPYSKTILTTLLVLYGGLAAPKLPKNIASLFENNIFRIIILSSIVYLGHKDPKFAVMISICFVISMDTLSNYKMFEKFSSYPESLEDGKPFEGTGEEIKCPTQMCH